MSVGQVLLVVGLFVFGCVAGLVTDWLARKRALAEAAPPTHVPGVPEPALSPSQVDLMNALRVASQATGPVDLRVGAYRVIRTADGKTTVHGNPGEYILPLHAPPPLSGMGPGSRGS
ncbi:MAG: hypothetical protein U0414_12110 [Polyangiaceae bacterium]